MADPLAKIDDTLDPYLCRLKVFFLRLYPFSNGCGGHDGDSKNIVKLKTAYGRYITLLSRIWSMRHLFVIPSSLPLGPTLPYLTHQTFGLL